MKKAKTVLGEARQIALASDLIHLGARLQVLESETTLSRERLLKLYKEIVGKSPPKGMLPFSTDWFMTWQPNIHSSLYINLYQSLNRSSELDEIEVVIHAYRMYREYVARLKMPKGYVIPPHRHPDTEVVTVISGTLRVGQGETVDRAKARLLGAGSLLVLSSSTPHFAIAETETVIQIASTGPFDVIYVNPTDDPRKAR